MERINQLVTKAFLATLDRFREPKFTLLRPFGGRIQDVYMWRCVKLHLRSIHLSAAAVNLKSSVVSRRERDRVPSLFKSSKTMAILNASRVVISDCTPQRGVERLNFTFKIGRGILTYSSGTSC